MSRRRPDDLQQDLFTQAIDQLIEQLPPLAVPPEDQQDQPDGLPVRGRAGRDAALALLEEHRAFVVARLREAAWHAWHATHQPVSVNDVRHILEAERYEGDPRVLGTTFPNATWVRVGFDQTNSRLANARPIGLFMPRVEQIPRGEEDDLWTTSGRSPK